MTIRKSNYQVINMCDFCAEEFGSCGASPLFSYEIDIEKDCDEWKNNKIDLSSDRLESWEEGILNEAINNLKLGAYDHRVTFYNIAKNILSNRSDVRVIGNNRGRPAPCKIVLYFSDAYQAASVKQLFNNSRIYTANGYKLIDKSTLLTDPSSQILELPIVSDRNKMDIIFEQLNSL